MFTWAKFRHNLVTNFVRGRGKYRPVSQVDCETAWNRQFDRVPCDKIVQEDPDDPAASWQRKKSEDDQPRECKECEGLLQAQSEPFDSGRGQEGQFFHLVCPADNEAVRILCVQG